MVSSQVNLNLKMIRVLIDYLAEWFRKLYEWTKLPLVPLYGGFPVKLRYIS